MLARALEGRVQLRVAGVEPFTSFIPSPHLPPRQKPNVHERLRDTQSDSYTQAAPAGTRIPRLSQQTSRTSQSYSLLVVAYLLRRISYFDFSCFYFMQKVSEGHLL